MKLKAVLYIGLLSLGVGCSNNDPRLDGEREMLDGSVFVKSDARFLVKSLPALNLYYVRVFFYSKTFSYFDGINF